MTDSHVSQITEVRRRTNQNDESNRLMYDIEKNVRLQVSSDGVWVPRKGPNGIGGLEWMRDVLSGAIETLQARGGVQCNAVAMNLVYAKLAIDRWLTGSPSKDAEPEVSR